MRLIISASSQYSPKDFRWVKFTGVRPVTFKKGRATFELNTGSVYGFTMFRRGLFYIISKDEMDVRFSISANDMRLLLNKSVGYEGRVQRLKVENGKPSTTLKPNTNAEIPKDPKYTATQAKPFEPKGYTTLLRKLDIPDAKTIKYIGHKRSLTDHDVEYYFDASKAALSLGKTWETKLETLVMKLIKADVTIGCTEVMYNNRITKVIVICEPRSL
jgi:hypothetical protein